MIHPRDFILEYVEPAHDLLRKNIALTHLAAHALAQMDILAEVTAIWVHAHGPDTTSKFDPRTFRDPLGNRHPVLAVIRDPHDSHKHGVLRNKSRAISKGQRPEVTPKAAFVVGKSYVGGPLTRYNIVTLTDNDGKEWQVHELLFQAATAWETELQALNL